MLNRHIPFIDAVTVFADPLLLFTEDSKHCALESREWVIGAMEDGFLVVFTQRNQSIRLISARKATKNERRRYKLVTGFCYWLFHFLLGHVWEVWKPTVKCQLSWVLPAFGETKEEEIAGCLRIRK